MKHFLMKSFGLALVLNLFLTFGCSKQSVAPPEPIAIDQLPAAMEKAFSKAKPAAKELATQVVASVQAQDYPKAYQELQTLTTHPDVTKEQSSIASGALMTVNDLLQAAMATGDQKSATTLRNYQLTK